MGKGLPWSEFTTAKAAKKAAGNYSTIMIGKWHLGDLWAKTNLPSYEGNYAIESRGVVVGLKPM
jgi:hypothetical protein